MNSRDLRVNMLIGTGHFLSHFYQLCLPPLFLAWQHQFNVSFAELGIVVVVMFTTAALLQTPVGFLVDRFGARSFLVGGTLLMSLSISCMSFATEYWQIVVLSLISGTGNAVFHPSDYAILAGSISPQKMGRSFAFHTLTGNIGFAAAPPVVAGLTLLMGWHDALLLLGLLGVPVAGAILWQSSILKDQVRRDPKAHRGMSMRDLLLERTLVLFFLFYLLGAMASGGIQAWLITILHEEKGLELALASAALTSYMIGSCAGTLVGGWAADNLTRYLVWFVVLMTGTSSVLTLSVNFLPVGGLVAVGLMLLSGVAVGASRTPRDVMLKDAAPPGQIGKVFGYVSSGLPLGSAMTPIPFGYLIDHGYTQYVLVLSAGLLLASLLCMGSAKASAKHDVWAPAE
jgi:MFS transporter, FSR family, fosmidomycin resistance protein